MIVKPYVIAGLTTRYYNITVPILVLLIKYWPSTFLFSSAPIPSHPLSTQPAVGSVKASFSSLANWFKSLLSLSQSKLSYRFDSSVDGFKGRQQREFTPNEPDLSVTQTCVEPNTSNLSLGRAAEYFYQHLEKLISKQYSLLYVCAVQFSVQVRILMRVLSNDNRRQMDFK